MQIVNEAPEIASTNLFDFYFTYVGKNEVPATYHRWVLISILGALVGRNVSLPFGHKHIYPNQYILLTGSPGARKGTAISIGKHLLAEVGYKHIAPNKAVKESFWKWMSSKSKIEEIVDAEEMLDWDVDTSDMVTEAFIAHDEFLDFIGIGDSGFAINLTNLWDNLPYFDNPKTRGNDVRIENPTVNILSGITPGGISEGFKAFATTGGFFSRLLYIYAEPTAIKITFPDPPDKNLEYELVSHLQQVRDLKGEIKLTPAVRHLLEIIYKSAPPIEDGRFQDYMQRRFTHLLKLITLMSVSRLSLIPTEDDCILANTILHNAEKNMALALGEYGKSKFSDAANIIIAALNNSHEPLTMKKIWAHVSRDLNKFTDLRDIMDGLLVADKIQKVTTKDGTMFLPNNQFSTAWPAGLVDMTLLRDDEHKE